MKGIIKDGTERVPGEEVLRYSDYEIVEYRQSTIDPEATIRVKVGMKCPRCKHVMEAMSHSKSRVCPTCNLRMQLYGNGLFCRP